MTAYDVTVTREDDLWVAVVTGGRLDRTAMDYERLADLREDVPLLIADLASAEPADVEVRYRYLIAGKDLTEVLEHLMTAELELTQVQHHRDGVREQVLHALAEAGVSQRVMADALGLSHQRVNQLLKAS